MSVFERLRWCLRQRYTRFGKRILGTRSGRFRPGRLRSGGNGGSPFSLGNCDRLKPRTKIQALWYILGHDEYAVILLSHFKKMFSSWGAGSREVLENQDRQIRLMGRSPSRQELVQQDWHARQSILRLERHCFACFYF